MGHPVATELSEHIDEAKRAVSEHGFERIFLATDADETIQQFKATFGDMVVCHNDVTRLQKDSNLNDIHELTLDLRDTRPEHGFLMGLEVLTDVYTLARCQGLIAAPSNVPYSALYINGGEYEYKKITYKGIYGLDVPHIRNMRDKEVFRYVKQFNTLAKHSEKGHNS